LQETPILQKKEHRISPMLLRVVLVLCWSLTAGQWRPGRPRSWLRERIAQRGFRNGSHRHRWSRSCAHRSDCGKIRW